MDKITNKHKEEKNLPFKSIENKNTDYQGKEIIVSINIPRTSNCEKETRIINYDEKYTVNLKFRKYSVNKDSPWKIKKITLEEFKSYEFINKIIKSTLESKIISLENLKIKLNINKKDNIIFSAFSKEDWDKIFLHNENDEFLKSIISDHNTIKLEYELIDINKNFNEIANKCDLQNKLIENLFQCIFSNENIKKQILDNLQLNVMNEKNMSNNFIDTNKEIFKKQYLKILYDYSDKVYETIYNNIKNYENLQDDLKKVNLDQELDFEDLENINISNNEILDEKSQFSIDESINYRSSFNLEKQEEMISKLIIESRNSLYK